MNDFQDLVRKVLDACGNPKGVSLCSQEHLYEMALQIQSSGQPQLGPTHYAVIDEHGEIVHASRIASYKDAEKDCKEFRARMVGMGEGFPDANNWTVKGVTVHE